MVVLYCSLMAIYIFVQRLIIIRQCGKEDDVHESYQRLHSRGKKWTRLNLCRSTNTPSARMIEKGITRLGCPMNDVL